MSSKSGLEQLVWNVGPGIFAGTVKPTTVTIADALIGSVYMQYVAGEPGAFWMRYGTNDLEWQQIGGADVQQVLGGLYCQDGSTAQSGIDTTPTLLTCFTAGFGTPLAMEEDAANDKVVMNGGLLGTGWAPAVARVKVDFQIDFEAAGGDAWTFQAYDEGGAAIPGLKTVTPAVTSYYHCGFTGYRAMAADDWVEVRVASNNAGGASMTVRQAQLSLIGRGSESGMSNQT